MDDEMRRWDLLVPASAEAAAKERFGDVARLSHGRRIGRRRERRTSLEWQGAAPA